MDNSIPSYIIWVIIIKNLAIRVELIFPVGKEIDNEIDTPHDKGEYYQMICRLLFLIALRKIVR